MKTENIKIKMHWCVLAGASLWFLGLCVLGSSELWVCSGLGHACLSAVLPFLCHPFCSPVDGCGLRPLRFLGLRFS